MAYPRFLRARQFKRGRRTAGHVPISSVQPTWTTVDTALDFTLAAAVGDTILAEINGMWFTEAPNAILDVVTLVGGNPVNSMGSGTTTLSGDGVNGWYRVGGALGPVTGSIWYVLQAADLSTTGTVTLRLRAALKSAGTRQFLADAGNPLSFFVQNLGPAGT